MDFVFHSWLLWLSLCQQQHHYSGKATSTHGHFCLSADLSRIGGGGGGGNGYYLLLAGGLIEGIKHRVSAAQMLDGCDDALRLEYLRFFWFFSSSSSSAASIYYCTRELHALSTLLRLRSLSFAAGRCCRLAMRRFLYNFNRFFCRSASSFTVQSGCYATQVGLFSCVPVLRSRSLLLSPAAVRRINNSVCFVNSDLQEVCIVVERIGEELAKAVEFCLRDPNSLNP